MRHTWVTYAVVGANVAMFAIASALGVHPMDPTPQQLVDVGASFPPLTLDGQPWRLAASMFLHVGLIHIALNMVCLWQGRVVELLYGRFAFTVLYLGSGMIAGAATLVRGGAVVSVGASGAVFGVYGAFGAYLVFRRAVIEEHAWRTTAKGIAMFVAINLVFGIMMPGISVVAHVAGLVAGFLLGAVVLAATNPQRPPSSSRAVIAAVIAGGAVVATYYGLPRPTDEWAAWRADAERIRTRWDHTVKRQLLAGEPKGDAAQQLLERDVAGPWRSACARFAGTRSGEGDRGERFEKVLACCESYLSAWDRMAAALRASGDEREQLMQQFRIEERDGFLLCRGAVESND